MGRGGLRETSWHPLDSTKLASDSADKIEKELDRIAVPSVVDIPKQRKMTVLKLVRALLCGIDCFVESIVWWIRLGDWSVGGVDRFVELIGWWNRSFGGFAWGIDRLVESIALWNWSVGGIDRVVELIAWWNRFVWNRSLGGIDFFGGGYERHSGIKSTFCIFVDTCSHVLTNNISHIRLIRITFASLTDQYFIK